MGRGEVGAGSVGRGRQGDPVSTQNQTGPCEEKTAVVMLEGPPVRNRQVGWEG